MPLDMNTGYPKKRKSKNPKQEESRNHQQNHREKSHDPRHNAQRTPSPSTPTSASPNLPLQYPTNHNPLFHFVPSSVTKINGPNASSKAIKLWDNNKMYGKSKESQNGADKYLSSLTTISDVEVSTDLQVVKVYVSVFGDDRGKEVAIAGLKSKAKYVRSQLGRRMKLRLTPEIRFIEDEGLERGSRVIAILDRIKAEKDTAVKSIISFRQPSLSQVRWKLKHNPQLLFLVTLAGDLKDLLA
ncbi:RIBOSOME-BINDING FACTOR A CHLOROPLASTIC-RELATED [Salix koriyanagi]|uniref:RIBOSOME-BINDING FACTOR A CHLOROPLASTIC-RELATED n=1 Tax=Salix koriyanagi TaxID=2511006 RepID=A0A9Q0ZLV0_9ROSI|nr:RIBOSOME-BINDING FACTOR A CHLOROPLASTIC-RELATED [Salix koriyanagi]